MLWLYIFITPYQYFNRPLFIIWTLCQNNVDGNDDVDNNDYNEKVKSQEESYTKRSKELENLNAKRSKEHEDSYAKRSKKLEDSYAKRVEELEKSTTEISDALAEEKQQWDLEKQTIASTHTFESLINLNVGGSKFTTTATTLTRFPDTMLGAMFSGRHKLTADASGHYFIDRDGTHFRHILNYLRCPEDFDASSISADHKKELKKEAEYYGLDSLMFPAPVEIETVDVQGSRVVLMKKDDIWYYTYWIIQASIPQIINYCKACSTVRHNRSSCNGSSPCSVRKIRNFSNLVGGVDPRQPSIGQCCICTHRHWFHDSKLFIYLIIAKHFLL